MPISAPKPCKHPACSALVHGGGNYCPTHKREVKRRYDERRESSTKRGYGYRWQQTSKGFLRAHPLCQCDECKEGEIRLRKSDVVDHIVPHKGDMNLFWDSDNWQAMSKECHDKKTAREDGGFGNPIKTN